MGLPAVITSDQGKEFHNSLNRELMGAFGVDHRLTTAYHPQANGLDERFNQTLLRSLAKFAGDEKEFWDVNLGEVVYAYNTAVQESTKTTPFEAMFCRQARLPVEFNAMEHYDPDIALKEFEDADEESESEHNARHKEIEARVRKNIAKAQERQK